MKKLLFPALLSFVLVLNGCLSADDEPFDPDAQLAADIQAIDEYLANNNIDAEEHESGFRYIIEEMGDGPAILDTFPIIMSYEARTLDDNVFDEDEEFYHTLNAGSLPAWEIGLPFINEGGRIRMFIPSGLAFGPVSLPGLAANSNVIYDITVRNSDIQLSDDLIEINRYLAENNITAEEHESGLRYVIHDPGDPEQQPDSRGLVRVNYEGRLLSDEVFDDGEVQEFDLRGVIMGWRIGVPLIGEGGSITLYIPSKLGFGPEERGIIRANAPLIFDVELVAVN